jgi:dTDP-D-glucose 4,6-dehydratase
MNIRILNSEKNEWYDFDVNNTTTMKTIREHTAQIMKLELQYQLIPVDRPGHDLCFSVDPVKLYDQGWQAPKTFEERLTETVNWYKVEMIWVNHNSSLDSFFCQLQSEMLY